MDAPAYAIRPSSRRDPYSRSDLSPIPSISTAAAHQGFSRGFASFASTHSPPTSSIAMSIPNSASGDEPPPPLPPPRFIPGLGEGPMFPHHPQDLSDHHKRDLTSSAGSIGSISDLGLEDRPHYKSRDKGFADEGYGSMSFGSSVRSQSFLPRHGMSHDTFQFRPSTGSDVLYDHDRNMLKKLNFKKTLDGNPHSRRSGLSASVNDIPASRQFDRLGQLAPLSLPDRTRAAGSHPWLDSPSQLTETPLRSAVSPRAAPFAQPVPVDYRSPASTDADDVDRSPEARSRRTNSGSLPDDSRDEDVDFPMEDSTTARLHDFHLHDRERERSEYAAAGQKRRASSPPGDDFPLASDLLRRRDGNVRGSPTPRLSVIPQGSVSSVSSAGRSNTSNLTLLTASSATSMASFGRHSPGSFSPGGLSPTDPTCGSPYTTPMSLTSSPRVSMNRSAIAAQQHQRTLSGQAMAMSPRKLAELKLSDRKLTELPKGASSHVAAKIQGFFMCECCPKKPKKFETREELSAHEAEKQYECAFCGNRFKNKNEAERHQNSLHVRRHSWSCSALTGYERAFHESPTRPGDADTCGYCGEEFTRNGPQGGPTQSGRFISDQDWEERIRHLQDVHKFRECNSSKKFYRADHFRQHLKHSHQGTSGKWTNMLENACMIEEEPPLPPTKH